MNIFNFKRWCCTNSKVRHSERSEARRKSKNPRSYGGEPPKSGRFFSRFHSLRMTKLLMQQRYFEKAIVWGFSLLAGVAIFCGMERKVMATPATLGFYPSTDTCDPGTFHLDISSYGTSLNANSSVTGGLTYGIGHNTDGLFGRSEIGFDYVMSLGGSAPSALGIGIGDRLLFNAKTQLFNDTQSGTRIVAGMWGVGDKAIFASDVGYITASKVFGFGRISFGLAHSFAAAATVTTPDGNGDRTNLYLGYDRYITPKVQFAMDYYSGKSSYSGLQPTLYYYVSDKASFGVGLMHFNDSSITPSRNQVYTCFDYYFGGGPAAATNAN